MTKLSKDISWLYETKRCSCCEQEKPLDCFARQSNAPTGLKYVCRECDNKKGRDYYRETKVIWKEKYKKKHRKSMLKHHYGITPEQYNAMYERQGGCCAICGRHQSKFARRLTVDHCHGTGKIRALLCWNCNNGLGCYKDDPELLIKAYQYLQKY